MRMIKKNNSPWDSLNLLSDFDTELDRIFNHSASSNGVAKGFNPDIEVKESKDEYTVRVDLPGVKKDDFGVSLDGQILTLSGKREEEKKSDEDGQYYSERFYGSFSRDIKLPLEVEANKIKAQYKDGVLEVILPKAEKVKPRQIEVKIN